MVKAIALLNLWFREKNGSTITANDADIEAAFTIWDGICDAQEFNVPPYIYQLYKEIILPAAIDKNGSDGDGEFTSGLHRQEVMQKHLQVYGRVLPDWLLRQQILPMLENAGLIRQERDPEDRRKVLIYPNPTDSLTVSTEGNNNEQQGRVTIENEAPKQDNTGQN